ncbi:hypothetical protein [Shimia sp.]|uniref:hypothetical protein n=1 Tax=Shimia sp. TaxID=1954381 RepID=UPI003BAC3A7E
MNTCFSAATSLCLLFAANATMAKVYECEATDEDTRLGVSPRSIVNIVDDEDKKLCTFSVNNYKADSPPQEELDAALERLFPNNADTFVGISQGVDSVPIDAFAALLVAAGPDSVIDEMEKILLESREALSSCLETYRTSTSSSLSGEPSASKAFDNGEFNCFVSMNGAFENDRVLSIVSEDSDQAIPTLIVWVQRGNLGNYLFLPK